ncbi:MAG: histidinol-phosphate transaminase [bacterium]
MAFIAVALWTSDRFRQLPLRGAFQKESSAFLYYYQQVTLDSSLSLVVAGNWGTGYFLKALILENTNDSRPATIMRPPTPPKHVLNLIPYQPGQSIAEIRELTGLERIIKLASNENPLGPSPLAVKRAQQAATEVAIYPRAGLTLRTALAKYLSVDLDNVIVGAGSEGVILHTLRTYLQPSDEAITAEGTFIGFYVIASAMNLSLKTVPLRADFTYDLDAMLAAVTPATKLIYIANPNNPTGTAISRSEWHDFLDALPDEILVMMDEAYFEYARDLWDEYPDSLEDRHDQVITLRTFSKIYGLAGSRIGYGVGHPEVIGNVLKVKLPFEPSWTAECAGMGAIEDVEFLKRTLRTNREGMKRLNALLDELALHHTRSIANFVLVVFDNAERAVWFSEELLKRGIIARPMVPFHLPNTVRITVGIPNELDLLEEALRSIISS